VAAAANGLRALPAGLDSKGRLQDDL
jgi:hypothetical protein